MVDPNIKFKRARRGYDPQEVDAVFDEFQWQITDLRRQNKVLSDTISQYDAKIALLIESTRRLEEERRTGYPRMTAAVNVVSRPVEQSDEERLKKASEILEQAQTSVGETFEQAKVSALDILEDAHKATENARKQALDSFLSTQTDLTMLNESMQSLCDYLAEKSARLSELSTWLSEKLGGASSDLLSHNELSHVPENTPVFSKDSSEIQPVSLRQTSHSYDDFMENIKQLGNIPRYQL